MIFDMFRLSQQLLGPLVPPLAIQRPPAASVSSVSLIGWCWGSFQQAKCPAVMLQVYNFNVPTFGKGVVYDVDQKVRTEQFRFFTEALKKDRLKKYVPMFAAEAEVSTAAAAAQPAPAPCHTRVTV